MAIADALLMELEQEAKTTQKVLDRVPESKLGWKPHAKSFSLGQLALHVAGAQGGIANMASQDTYEIGPMIQKEAATKKEILEALTQGTANAKQVLGKMDDARLMATWTLTKNGNVLMSIPRAAMVRALMMNHIYHHRGQLSVYLRLLDVPVPSIYGPSADENPFG